jgi:hypothetical protein
MLRPVGTSSGCAVISKRLFEVCAFLAIVWFIFAVRMTEAVFVSVIFLIFFFVRPKWIRYGSLGVLVAGVLFGLGI